MIAYPAAKWERVVAGMVLYFLLVFGVGFLLGPIRLLWLEPKLGEMIAILCEAPFLLGAIVLAARWVPKNLNVPKNVASLAVVGTGALAIQQGADVILGMFLRGIAPTQLFASFYTATGLIYLTLLVAFTTMPVLVHWRRT